MSNVSSVLSIDCHAGPCGSLAHDGRYFLSTPGSNARTEVSLTLPHRAAPYASDQMHAIFQMNLPEGRLLEEITLRLSKTTHLDPMMLLSLTGNSAPIERLRCSLPGQKQVENTSGESLAEILAWDGSEDLFKLLFDRYVLRSGISGVQPKVVVPVQSVPQSKPPSMVRTTTATEDLIIKSGMDEYPHMAINEFVCMSIAKEAGIPTPDFYLSKNQQMFVMRRFDRLPTQRLWALKIWRCS